MAAAELDRVSTLTRCLAKGVDLCVILLFSVIVPYPLGVLLGFFYTLVHDGLGIKKFKGQSLGKHLFGLRVVHTKPEIDGIPITIRESVIRNAPLGVATFFGIIPFWGWILLVLLGVPLVVLEIYLMKTQESGTRLGDVMADTKVTSASK